MTYSSRLFRYFPGALLGPALYLILSGSLAAQTISPQTRLARGLNTNHRELDRQAASKASRAIRGPVLGFLLDGERTITPILGIPGATATGRPFRDLPELRAAVVSAERGYAVGISGDEGRVLLLRGLNSTPVPVPLKEIAGGENRLVISPTGSALAAFNRDTGAITVVKNLPDAPETAWRAAASSLPGPVSAMAVSDDGTTVLVAAGNEGRSSVMVLTAGHGWRYVAGAGMPVSLGFLANRPDGLIADGAASEVFLVRDPANSAAIRVVAGPGEGVSSPIAVAVARDNSKVAVVNAGAGGIVVVALDGAAVTKMACHCSPTGIERLNGNLVFRIREAEGAPLRVFDGDAPQPRLLFLPPAPVAGKGVD